MVWDRHAHCMICSSHKDCPHKELAEEAELLFGYEYSNGEALDVEQFFWHYDDLEEDWKEDLQEKKKRSFNEAFEN